MILLQSSLVRLQTVHEDLRNVILLTAEIAPMAFVVTEGVRTLARQRELFLAKKSQTMNSRHLAHPSDGLSRAVDLAIWEDRDLDRVAHARWLRDPSSRPSPSLQMTMRTSIPSPSRRPHLAINLRMRPGLMSWKA